MTKPGFALPVRIWNYLALAALEADGSICASNLLVFLSAFSHSYASSLASHLVRSPFGSGPSELATSDINQAYSGLKLWLLLTKKKFSAMENEAGSRRGMRGVGEDQAQLEKRIWGDLWPPFSRLVNASVEFAGSEMHMVSLGMPITPPSKLCLLVHLRLCVVYACGYHSLCSEQPISDRTGRV